jgi:hypothetical protein
MSSEHKRILPEQARKLADDLANEKLDLFNPFQIARALRSLADQYEAAVNLASQLCKMTGCTKDDCRLRLEEEIAAKLADMRKVEEAVDLCVEKYAEALDQLGERGSDGR